MARNIADLLWEMVDFVNFARVAEAMGAKAFAWKNPVNKMIEPNVCPV
jgi:hypothetical protein